MNLFEGLGLSSQLLTAVQKLGYTEPTQIQRESIPHIMAGRDVIGESATGSGKTLAFGCGIIEKTTPRGGLQALVLTPTRELAEQVKQSLWEIAYQKHLRIIAVYGGVAINPQISGLMGADVVVATPGRLLDHLERKTVNLSKVKILVLDEADRMFDMGFLEDVERIIRACPAKRQTMCFSATISSRIKELANKHMNQPAEASARNLVDPSKLKQVYYDVEKNMKLSLLVHLLQSEKAGLTIVFCNTRRTTDFVVKNLKANKIDAIATHGGLSQNKRTKMLQLFDRAKAGVLVCTDVAARGLDIDNISHVYNYNIPKDPKDYVHRIGRTARAGEEGKAINLVCDYDYENFSRIINDYKAFSIQKIERPYVQRVIATGIEGRERTGGSWGRQPRGARGDYRREGRQEGFRTQRRHSW